MNSFDLHLQSATQYEHVRDVTSFTGVDSSGSFSLLPGHERFMSSLVFGLSRFKTIGGSERYLASPGAIIYFKNNEMFFSTRRYLIDESYDRIRELLDAQLKVEELNLQKTRDSLRRMENAMLKRLWQLGGQGEGL